MRGSHGWPVGMHGMLLTIIEQVAEQGLAISMLGMAAADDGACIDEAI